MGQVPSEHCLFRKKQMQNWTAPRKYNHFAHTMGVAFTCTRAIFFNIEYTSASKYTTEKTKLASSLRLHKCNEKT